MRRFVVLVVLPALAFAVTGCGGSSNMLAGTWELIDANGGPPETPSIKVLNADHFAFGGQADDGSVWAGGGSYRIEDGKYIENVEYHSMPFLVGRSLMFSYRLEGDRWYHDGDFEAGGRRFHIREIWRRVKE
jgi:hypothetical protein